jgi:dihydroorotase (multifunctional complex type)
MLGGSVLVRGGRLVSRAGVRRADVRIVAGRIVDVGPNLPIFGEPVVDAGDLLVLPGVVDAHCHQWEDGMASRPDFRDESAAAAVGGVTTFIDMPLTTPEITDAARFRDKAALGERTSLVDFALHAGASPDRIDQLPELWAAGATGIKIFTCETGCAMRGFVDEPTLRVVLECATRLHALALIHAEDQPTLDRNRALLEEAGRADVNAFGEWHSPGAERAAIQRVLRIAGELGGRVYFVHTSLPEGVADIVAARQAGVLALVETCPQYLWLTSDDIKHHGAWRASAPPVRDKVRRDALRACLAIDIDVVGSDHNAVSRAAKARGGHDPFNVQPGLPGVELTLPLMLDLVAEDVLPLERCVALLAERPAEIFGLAPRKGFLKPGADGDVVLVDMAGWTEPSDATTVSAAGWTPYAGLRLRGRVRETILRGRRVALDGVVCGEAGYGGFVRRQKRDEYA